VRDTREPGGISTRRGASCGVPGLAVAEAGTPGAFSLIHVRSGLVLAVFGDPEGALAGAQAVAGLADWTAPASHVRAVPDLASTTRAALAPLGAYWAGTLAGPDSLADLTEAQP
jgi:hypothetical protein